MMISIIGAGLSGSEAALSLAKYGKKVRLFEQKPKKRSAAHRLEGPAELVCSNSLKSLDLKNSHGLLKEELRLLDSPVLDCAMNSRVPGGKALSVEREKMSALVLEKIQNEPLIEYICEPVHEIPVERPLLLASGPLTSDALWKDLSEKLGDQGLYFYDATSPVVSLSSLDMSKFFWASRNQENDDYLNLPLTREQYENFRTAILSAEKTEAHLPDEKLKFFEGCLPIEVLAERGLETLACSCMSPSSLPSPQGTFAVIQFRREKAAGELLSMVGFQTRMKWPEQERVFRSLPGMEQAEFVRLGAMHRNSFINAPLHLNDRLELKAIPGVHLAGQITGSEGYSEALATGHYAALMLAGFELPPETTAIRSLVRYLINSDPKTFQPMNFNFGLLPPLEKLRMKKAQRIELRVERALKDFELWLDHSKIGLKHFWKEAL